MGCLPSKQSNHSEAIPPEYLMKEILGYVADDDYLAMASESLKEFSSKEPTVQNMNQDSFLDYDHAYKLFSEDQHTEDNGYVRGPNGDWYIASTMDMGDVTGEMFDWWFRVCEDTEQFKWWHPTKHLSGDWDLPFHALQLYERQPGYYVDHINSICIHIDGRDRTLTLDFDRPSKHFGDMPSSNSVVICARIHTSNSLVGWIGFGHVVYILSEVNGRNLLRCRYWLGDVNKIDDNSLCHPSFVNWFGNTNTFRYFSATESLSKSFWTYSQESMHCLKSFLPHYYNKMTRLGNVFELRRAIGDGDGEEGASSDQVEVQIANGGRMGKRGVGWEDE